MQFTSAELSAWIGAYLWPFIRIGALLSSAAIFGARFVPMRLRLVLALSLTVVIAPTLPPVPAVDGLSGAGLAITAQQVLIGLAMGFTLRLVFTALELGGQLAGQMMGLGFASMIDPQNGVSVPVVSQLYSILGILLFLGFNGHLLLIEVLADSFRTLPIGAAGLSAEGARMLALWGSQMFAGAVVIALPAIAALLLVNMSFAVMMRAAPQLNIFAVGFPATLLFGLFVVMLSLTGLPNQLMLLTQGYFDLLRAALTGA